LLISETPGQRGGAIGIVSCRSSLLDKICALLTIVVEDLIEEIIGEEIVSFQILYRTQLIPRLTRRIEFRIISPKRQSSEILLLLSCVSYSFRKMKEKLTSQGVLSKDNES
jgi:hypothetical protein